MMSVWMRLTLLIVLVFITPGWSNAAEEFQGRIVGVTDGDTVTVLTPTERQVKVRLAEIDTPEGNQPYGTRAKQALSGFVFGHTVRVIVVGTDRYGRTIGHVYVGDLDVNAEMVRSGMAWVYREYNRDPSLLALEKEAKEAGRGLWDLPEAQRIPPWEWRKARHHGG
jgi:endonuclease YncB( thermonuclease family)